MVNQDRIAVTIDAQRALFLKDKSLFLREARSQFHVLDNFATIVTGLRRSGKSTLLLQLLKQARSKALYLNFEDTRLAGFELDDFDRLSNEIVRRGAKTLLFDEIQLVKGWEIFVHQKLREGYHVLISGSNASLLSRELGTRLTGRHLSYELFPFSYREFVKFKKLKRDEHSLREYMFSGGIPEYLKTGVGAILNSLMDDVLVRDIAIRYGVRDVTSLRKLAVYLMSNICAPVSANRLEGLFGVKANSTLLEYFSYFKDAYLLEFLPQFSYSLKAQARNPKKVYATDIGLFSQNSTVFSDGMGRRLENLVYIFLRTKFKELYYFNGKGECDFVAHERGQQVRAVQVCYHVDNENFNREYNGLAEAMREFKLTEGVIVTFNQKDVFQQDGMTVRLIPAYEYLYLEKV